MVLEPTAVADILQLLSAYGFNARAVAEGRSFAKLGEQQFDPAITFVDDPLSTSRPGRAVRRRRHAEAAAGAGPRRRDVSALAHDRRTAQLLGAASTGHAVPGGERMGAIPLHPPLRPGATADLVAGLERGLLVTDFWYTRVLDPLTQVVTGLTRNGVWLVENGELVRPVRNLRFTQSYVDALAPGNVLAVGADARPGPGQLARRHRRHPRPAPGELELHRRRRGLSRRRCHLAPG